MTGRLRELLRRALATVGWRSRDRDLDDELASHLDAATSDYTRQGLSLDEARRRARIDLGGVAAAREQHREARGLPWIAALAQDARYALRTIRRSPGFSTAAILILALGIGANTSVFSIVNPLLLKPLPFDDADELVWVADVGDRFGLSGQTYSVDAFETFRERSQSFADLSAFNAFFDFGTLRLGDDEQGEAVFALSVAPRFFETLEVQPAIGRLFTDAETRAGAASVAMLSDGVWRRRYDADPGIVGRSIRMNNEPVEIVGVLPAGFDFGAVFTPGTPVDVFSPANLDQMRGWGNVFSIVGRLRPGETIEAARAELGSIVSNMRRERSEWEAVGARLTPLKTRVSGAISRPLVVLWSAVALVLLIACANLSNLLLARANHRRRELAIRLALGAGRVRVLRQMLAEGVVLAFAGAAAGLPTAYAIAAYVRTRTTLNLPLLSSIEVDRVALLFTMAVTLLAGLLAGALPALRAIRQDPQRTLRDHGRGASEGPAHRRVRSVLVVAEVAVACVLLIGAGLLLKSFVQLAAVDVGFRHAGAFAVRLDAPGDDRRDRFLRAVDTVAALPGVAAAGLTDALPLSRNRTWFVGAADRRLGAGEMPPLAFVYMVTGGYVDAMGIPLKRGRDFGPEDTADSLPVVMINETLARVLWGDRDPVGRDVDVNFNGEDRRRVVGVVADVRQTALDEPAVAQAYFPASQTGGGGAPNLVMRSTLPLATVARDIRTALGPDATLLSSAVVPVSDLVDRVLSPRRFLLTLIGAFAALALLLAALGIYAVIAYGVTQRTREIGIRMALGAAPEQVRLGVVMSAGRLAIIGVAIGLVGAFGASRLITALLYDTSPLDPATFAGVAVGLIVVALVAGHVPARRASRIDPVEALRGE